MYRKEPSVEDNKWTANDTFHLPNSNDNGRVHSNYEFALFEKHFKLLIG